MLPQVAPQGGTYAAGVEPTQRAGAGPSPARARGVRSSMLALAVLAVLAVMGPGLAVYALLRTLGAGIGPAGLAGLALMLVGTFGYCAWLFGGGRAGGRAAGAGRRPG